MAARTCPPVACLPLVCLPLALVLGCPWPDFVFCEESGACGTTGPDLTTSVGAPTTSDGAPTVTGDSVDASSGSAIPDTESGGETIGTTDQSAQLPVIVDGVVIPDYIDENGLLNVAVTTQHADGARMLLDSGDLIELTPIRPGAFGGQIPAFTGLDNGKPHRRAHTLA